MKKVALVVNDDNGLYLFRSELIFELTKKYEVDIIVPKGTYNIKLKELGANIINIKIDRRGTNPFNDIILYRQYKKILKKTNPDIVLTFTIKPNIYGGLAAQKLKIPYVANITGLGTAVENKGLLQKITKILYKKSFKKINTVFFQNKENMDFFNKSIIKTKNNILIPGSGVNLNKFELIEYPKNLNTKFVFIARLLKEKGIEYYLKLAKDIKKDNPKVEFHICGAMEDDYRNLITEYQDQNLIEYHGKVDDIRQILKVIDCTIHPTYYAEGMSNVLLESSASGRPVITFDRSGCKEIVEDKITGYLVQTHNYDELLKTVQNFLMLSYEEKSKMGLAAREKVKREFDRNIVVNEYLQEIKSIIGA